MSSADFLAMFVRLDDSRKQELLDLMQTLLEEQRYEGLTRTPA